MNTPNETSTNRKFRDKLLAMLEWVAERDPVTAARLMSDWAEEVKGELVETAQTDGDLEGCCCGC